jgi:magnesium-transporting ATPase (P-type)
MWYSPKEMLKEVPKFSFGRTFLYLALSVLLWFFAVKIQGATWLSSLYVLIGALLLVLLGSLVLNLMLVVLNKVSLLALIPTVGVYLVGLAIIFAIPFIMITQIRIFTDLFKVDMLTSIVVLFILGAGTAAGFAGVLGTFAAQFVGKIGFGLLPSIL